MNLGEEVNNLNSPFLKLIIERLIKQPTHYKNPSPTINVPLTFKNTNVIETELLKFQQMILSVLGYTESFRRFLKQATKVH